MATVTAFIRVSTKKTEKANVRFRLRDGRDKQLFYKSDLEIKPSFWNSKKQEMKEIIETDKIASDFNVSVANIKKLVLDTYKSIPKKEGISSEILKTEIDKAQNPEKYSLVIKEITFIELFSEFIEERKISTVRKNNYRVVVRALKRYELFKQAYGIKDFKLSFENVTSNTLRDIEHFLSDEHKLFEKYPKIYEAVPESRTPQPRGQNTINGIFNKFRSFYIWANDNGKTTINPFRTFKIQEDVYGTPFYISIEERNRLHKTNLSRHPRLAIQRDIFIFHCLLGCRVGDLYRLTRNNIINGAIEYVARKTRDGHPVTVRVPLNSIAKEILNKYIDSNETGLLPFISEQKYNDAIKRMFLAARLKRPVTIINSTTREPEIKPLNTIASSHMARRCFIGNLYKQVKDPNLVGALSGHKEGSKAFARYREIDEQMKTDLVKMLE